MFDGGLNYAGRRPGGASPDKRRDERGPHIGAVEGVQAEMLRQNLEPFDTAHRISLCVQTGEKLAMPSCRLTTPTMPPPTPLFAGIPTS